MHHRERSIINRPIEEVFAFAVDPRNHAAWNAWVVDTTVTNGEPIAVGTRFSSTMKFLGKRVNNARRLAAT